jgi:hypothetical protein
VTAPTRCPVCGTDVRPSTWQELATHLVELADASDDRHVMWLNRNVTKHRVDAAGLAPLLERVARGEPASEQERVRR